MTRQTFLQYKLNKLVDAINYKCGFVFLCYSDEEEKEDIKPLQPKVKQNHKER